MKASNFIIGIIMTSAVMALLAIVVAGFFQAYPRDDYDSSTLDAYNKLDNISSTADDIRTEVSGIEQNRDALDVIGGFFVSSYKAIIITANSIDLFDSMANSAVEDTSLGQAGFIIKTAMVVAIIILIFVGVIMAAIAKWPI